MEELKLALGENCKYERNAFANLETLGYCSEVYDGDTITVSFLFGGNLMTWRIRILGIDTPEIRTRDKEEKVKGLAAKKRCQELCEKQFVTLKIKKLDNFSRLLADVTLENGNDLGTILLQENYAVVCQKFAD